MTLSHGDRSGMSRPASTGPAELRAARRKGLGLLVWAFIFSVFVNILMLTGPLYMLQIYDRVLASRSVETLVALSVLVGALYALMAVLDFARGRVMARVGARFQTALDARVFEAALLHSTDPKDRAVSTAALRDLDGIKDLFISPVLLALMDTPWTPMFIAAIFLFHPWLGWLAVAGGSIIVVLALVNQLVTAHRVRTAQIAVQKTHAFVDQARNGAEVVLSQGLGRNMVIRYLRQRNESLAQNLAATDWTGSFTAFTKSFRLFLQSAMLGLGAYLAIQGAITPGSMIAGSILLGRALAPIEQAMGGWPVIQRARAGWRMLGNYLKAVPQSRQRTELPAPPARFTVTGLTIMPPGAKKPTVKNLTFRLEPGQALGVIGRSGSGKSTLARSLSGYWPLAAGEVRLGGTTLDQYGPEDLGRHIGYLPQAVRLFAGTVAENIARMSMEPDDKAVVKAAQRSNAHDMIMQLPDGYDTFIDGNDNQLSGGQRQRVALARALYGDPVLLILDEPNSMLDAEGSEALNNTVREFKELKKSVIVMTHRPQAIAECEMLMVLDQGVMVAYGPRDEVLEKTVRNLSPVRKSITKPDPASKKVAF